MFKKVIRAVAAAVTSPAAVKAEKNLGVLVAVRVALAVGASTGVVEFISKLAR